MVRGVLILFGSRTDTRLTGVPTPAGREEILRALLGTLRCHLSPTQVRQLAASTHGFVGADLGALCREAAMGALRRRIQRGGGREADNLNR